MNRNIILMDESSMSPQAKAAMYAANKKVMLRRRGKVELRTVGKRNGTI